MTADSLRMAQALLGVVTEFKAAVGTFKRRGGLWWLYYAIPGGGHTHRLADNWEAERAMVSLVERLLCG